MQKEIDQYVRDELLKCRPQWLDISARVGVSYDWMRKYVTGQIPNPGINTLRKLRDHFKGKK